MVKPARDVFRLLLDLCEHPEPMITGKALREGYGASAAALLKTGALSAGPNLAHLSISADDDEECEVEIERDEAGRPGYRHPRSGRWRTLLEGDLLQYRLNVQFVLSQLAGALEIPDRFQSVELVPGLLWELGEARFGKRSAPVLFARRMTTAGNIDRICDVLINRIGKSDGLLLTSTRELPRHLEVPGRHRTCSLHCCFDPASSAFTMDRAVLNGLFGMAPSRSMTDVECSPDGSMLTIHGKEYPFKGPKQRAIVRLLYQAWRDGKPKQQTSEILRKAGSNADQIRQAFAGSPTAWSDVIGYGDGQCWLKIEAS